MATGTAARNAIRPDHRCSGPIQLGDRNGSLPYIVSADTSWTTASVAASVASHTFTSCGPENPATLTATPVGVCSRPNTPRTTDTAAPISSTPSSPVWTRCTDAAWGAACASCCASGAATGAGGPEAYGDRPSSYGSWGG